MAGRQILITRIRIDHGESPPSLLFDQAVHGLQSTVESSGFHVVTLLYDSLLFLLESSLFDLYVHGFQSTLESSGRHFRRHPSISFLLISQITQHQSSMYSNPSAASAMLLARRIADVNKFRASAVTALSRSFTASPSDAPNPGSGGRSVDVARRRDAAPVPRLRRVGDLFPAILGDTLDPFNPRRSLIDAFNLVNQMLDFPFGAGWRGWDAREDDKALYLKVEMPGLGKDDKALYLKVEMPGLGKDDVQVKVENNTLVIKGEAPKEGVECGEGEQGGDEGRESGRRRYNSRIELPKNQYNLERIRAEMKNGVLRAVVPKVKMEERKNVRDIPIE